METNPTGQNPKIDRIFTSVLNDFTNVVLKNFVFYHSDLCSRGMGHGGAVVTSSPPASEAAVQTLVLMWESW